MEDEEPEYEGIGRNNLAGLDEDMEEEEVGNVGYQDIGKQDQYASYEDLKSGIQSLIEGAGSAVDIKKSKVPLPSEPRPLY